jgi:hypothetical protein
MYTSPPPNAPSLPSVNKPPAHLAPPVGKKDRIEGCAVRIIAVMIILGAMGIVIWTQRAYLPALFGLLATPTRTTIPTLPPKHTPTPVPTRTPFPTATATPEPVIVTFDTIGAYPEGQMVILSGLLEMFKSTYCDTECGLLFTEYSGSKNKITIFVEVAQPGVAPSPNQMKALPDPYSKWDIVVCLNDGTLAYIGNRITVTGRICKTTSGEPCISHIIKIEKENK